ncbi:MAG: hypothetical protein ACTTJV_07465 [Ottowia sp.]
MKAAFKDVKDIFQPRFLDAAQYSFFIIQISRICQRYFTPFSIRVDWLCFLRKLMNKPCGWLHRGLWFRSQGCLLTARRLARLAFVYLFLPVYWAHMPQRPWMLRQALSIQEKSVDKLLDKVPLPGGWGRVWGV